MTHELALGGAILGVIASQLLLRVGARNKETSLDVILNWKTLAGYASMGLVVLATIYAMQKIPLRTAATWNSATFVLTPIAARYVLGDPLHARTAMGSVLIVVGIVIFSLG